jgi:SAM-dependent methyltransferase
MEPREFHWPFSFLYSSLARFMEPGYRDLSNRMEIHDDAKSLLDVGGGDGRLSIALAQMYPSLHCIVSGDISEDMTKRAQRRVTKAGLSSTISAECLDMHALPYSDARFDVVVSFGTLHHARHPLAVLAEAYRVLRPGGRMCVIDGYGRPSFAAIREAVGQFGGSFISAVAYWCGSKDCLPRERIAGLVSSVDLPGIEVVFDGLLATISGTKKNSMENSAPMQVRAG